MKLYVLPPYLLQHLVWVPVRLGMNLFLGIKIEGLENLADLPKGAIFATNHASEFDPVLVTGCIPFFSRHLPFFYTSLSKSYYRHLGVHARLLYGGIFFKLWGAYPVERGIHDYKKSLLHHIRILSDGNSVCIFPEGQISKNGKLGEGKRGAAYLSWITNRPIVPVAINGAWQMTLKEILTRKRKVTVRFGKPIPRRELFSHETDPSSDDLKNAMFVTMRHIAELYVPEPTTVGAKKVPV